MRKKRPATPPSPQAGHARAPVTRSAPGRRPDANNDGAPEKARFRIRSDEHASRRLAAPMRRRALLPACLLPLLAQAKLCTEAGRSSIFLTFQEENPDAVLPAEDGCTVGGGRGEGCCSGTRCFVCEYQEVINQVTNRTARWFQCECELCPAGQAQPTQGNRACETCPPGWFADERGAEFCKPCPAGHFNPDEGRGKPCDPCEAGTYSLSTLAEFRKAVAGPFAAYTGAFDPREGASSCAKCPAGSYASKSRGSSALDCLPCPPGTYSDDGSSECSLCPKGTFNPYWGKPGVASCELCEAGSCTDGTGAAYCYQCCPSLNIGCDDPEWRGGPLEPPIKRTPKPTPVTYEAPLEYKHGTFSASKFPVEEQTPPRVPVGTYNNNPPEAYRTGVNLNNYAGGGVNGRYGSPKSTGRLPTNPEFCQSQRRFELDEIRRMTMCEGYTGQ